MPNSRKKSPPNRDSLLAAIPQQNQLVRSTPHGRGGLRLTAPLKPNPLRKIFFRKTAAEKSFDLDDLGAWAWNHIDGKTTVESLIQQFAQDHRVTPHESEVALLAFLKTLTQRNLVALVTPDPDKLTR